MTRKEALATLYRLRDAYLDLLYAQDRATFAASEAMRHESYRALLALTDALHGKPRGSTASLFLCEVCHLRRADLSSDEPLWLCAGCHKAKIANAEKPDGGGTSMKSLAQVLGGDGASCEEQGFSLEFGTPHPYSSRELASRQAQGGHG